MVSQTAIAGNPSLKAVIFDVDGTLVDSNDLHIEAWREAFAHYGIGLTYDKGMEVWTTTPRFAAYIKSEYDKCGRVIREAGTTAK